MLGKVEGVNYEYCLMVGVRLIMTPDYQLRFVPYYIPQSVAVPTTVFDRKLMLDFSPL